MKRVARAALFFMPPLCLLPGSFYRQLCALNILFVHKLPFPYQLCAPNDTFVHKLPHPAAFPSVGKNS